MERNQMERNSYIGIESFNHYNDDIYKKIIINRLLDAEDLTNIIKSFLFIPKAEHDLKMRINRVIYNIKYAKLSVRKTDDRDETWAFCVDPQYTSNKQFQATSCGICGEYINTSTIYFLCAENAKCFCHEGDIYQ
jgi:hypothetical protein